MLLGELRRWGLAAEPVERLLPHADRALAWIDEYGDRDGDGYVEYHRATDRGRVHQGWKGSPDAVRAADGRARPGADRPGRGAGLRLRRPTWPGPTSPARPATTPSPTGAGPRPRRCAANFNRDFWLEDQGWLAMALDGDRKPLDALDVEHGPLPVDRHPRR